MTALTLADKLAALERITRRAGWNEMDRASAEVKFRWGHEKHGDDFAGLYCHTEAFEEALDLAGYAALAKLQGRWSWRWWLVVFLAGIQGRLLMAEARAQEKRHNGRREAQR